jgi:hypothetical protein
MRHASPVAQVGLCEGDTKHETQMGRFPLDEGQRTPIEPARSLVERLSVPETGHFSLMIHHAELVKDPVSRATESSRSNLMAAQHTIRTVYGEAVAREVADLV